MVHNAFDSVQILKDCPVKIDSMGLWGPRLLVGCMDGSLRMYAPETIEDPPSLSTDISPKYVLKDTRIGFAKKAVTSMDVLQSRSLLISLSDAVAIHTLPDFDVVAYLTKTKGSSMYAWDEERGMLCVAKLKKLFLYRYDGNREFAEIKELTSPDVVKSMAWCGDTLCLGIRREYLIMNISTGATFDVFPCGRSAAPLAVRLPNGEVLLGKVPMSKEKLPPLDLFTLHRFVFLHRIEVQVVLTGNSELLNLEDNIGVFVDRNGKLSHSGEGNLSWSEAPGAVIVHPPYALARLSRFLEVRSLRTPYGLVQTLPLRDSQLLLASEAGLVAASDHSAYRLTPVPIGVQVVQLAASGDFDDALALCKLLPPEDAALRASKEDAIHIRYGQYLFEKKEYEKAMDHFAASSLDLTTILYLFPTIKLPDVGILNKGKRESVSPSAEKCLTPSSSGNLEETATVLQTLSISQANLTDAKQTKIALGALITFLMKKRGAIIERAEAEDTEAVVAAMVEVAATHHRQVKSFDKYTEAGEDRQVERRQDARELAVVLDTAVVQALLATDNLSTALQLLSGPNFADVGACEDVMLAGGHYAELLQLYKSNHNHRPALLLLNRLAEHPENFVVPPKNAEQFGAMAIVDYLKSLETVDHSLVMEFSGWVLKVNPEQALSLYVTLDPPLPPSLVLSHLKEHAPELQVPYLEQVMNWRPDTKSLELQNELVQLYLNKVLEERLELELQGRWDEKNHSESRQKLLASLESSSYNAERVLQRLPVDGLYEERAFLLGRMRQHRLALTLYAHKLHQPQLALAYCDHVYASSSAGSRHNIGTLASLALGPFPKDPTAANVYLTLLEVYLKPQAATKEFDRSIASLTPVKAAVNQRATTTPRAKGTKKIAQIEDGAYYGRQTANTTDSTPESGRSEGEAEPLEQHSSVGDGLMLQEALGLLSQRWDRLDGAQALRMLPSDTELQQLMPFLEPLLCKSSESHRNAAVIKNLRRSESLQVRQELMQCRKRMVKVTSDRTCSICHKRIGSSVFAVYPNGTLVHFVCYRDSQSPKPAAGP